MEDSKYYSKNHIKPHKGSKSTLKLKSTKDIEIKGENRGRSKDFHNKSNSVSNAPYESFARSRSTSKKKLKPKQVTEMAQSSDIQNFDTNRSPDSFQSYSKNFQPQNMTNPENNSQYQMLSARSDQNFMQLNNPYMLPQQQFIYPQQPNPYGFDPNHQSQKSFSNSYSGYMAMQNPYMPMGTFAPQPTFQPQHMQQMGYPGFPNSYYPQIQGINPYYSINNSMNMMPYQFPIQEASSLAHGQNMVNYQSMNNNQPMSQENNITNNQQVQDMNVSSPSFRQGVNSEQHAEIKNYVGEQEQFLKKLDQDRKRLQERVHISNIDAESKVNGKPFSQNQLSRDSKKSDILQQKTDVKSEEAQRKLKKDESEEIEKRSEQQKTLRKDFSENEIKLQNLKKKTDYSLERSMKPNINVIDDLDESNDDRYSYTINYRGNNKFSKLEKGQEKDENLQADSSQSEV